MPYGYFSRLFGLFGASSGCDGFQSHELLFGVALQIACDLAIALSRILIAPPLLALSLGFEYPILLRAQLFFRRAQSAQIVCSILFFSC